MLKSIQGVWKEERRMTNPQQEVALTRTETAKQRASRATRQKAKQCAEKGWRSRTARRRAARRAQATQVVEAVSGTTAEAGKIG